MNFILITSLSLLFIFLFFLWLYYLDEVDANGVSITIGGISVFIVLLVLFSTIVVMIPKRTGVNSYGVGWDNGKVLIDTAVVNKSDIIYINTNDVE